MTELPNIPADIPSLESAQPGVTPAGWYRVPDGRTLYFDGNSWVVPESAQTQPVSAPRKGLSAGAIAAITVGAIIGVCGIVGTLSAAVSTFNDNASHVSAQPSPEATSPTTLPSHKLASPPATTAAPKKAASPVAGLNTAVRDGKFEFTVTKVKCGLSQVGGQYLNKKAQGQFCLVTMVVKNIGDKPQTFDDSNQQAFNAAGQKYDANGVASMYANDDNQTFLNSINPGNKVTGTVVFDIPRTQKLTKLELHDSAFSGGVEVRLV